jgi:tetratricopeptide (TPR) repeat protein
MFAGKADEALAYVLEAKKLLESLIEQNPDNKYKLDLSAIYCNIGEVYALLGGAMNLELAKELFKKSIALDEELYNESKLSYSIMMLTYRRTALLYEKMGDFETARCYHKQAFDVLTEARPASDGDRHMARMCLISNLLEITEKNYISNSEKLLCYQKAIDELKFVADEERGALNLNALMVIQDLEKKIQDLKA